MNVAPKPQPIGLDQLLSESWRLLRTNPSVVVPLLLGFMPILIIGVPAFVAIFKMDVGHPRGAPLTPQEQSMLVAFFVAYAVAAVLAAIGFNGTIAMADQLWTGRAASIGRALRVSAATLGQCALAFLVLIPVEFIFLFLGILTLGLAFLAFAVFIMYMVPAVIARRNGYAAVVESFRLVVRWFGQSALLMLVLVGIQFGIGVVLWPLNALLAYSIRPVGADVNPVTAFQLTPSVIFIGGLEIAIAVAISLGTYSFYSLAVVGMYRSLRGLGEGGDGQPAALPPTEVRPVGAEG